MMELDKEAYTRIITHIGRARLLTNTVLRALGCRDFSHVERVSRERPLSFVGIFSKIALPLREATRLVSATWEANRCRSEGADVWIIDSETEQEIRQCQKSAMQGIYNARCSLRDSTVSVFVDGKRYALRDVIDKVESELNQWGLVFQMTGHLDIPRIQ